MRICESRALATDRVIYLYRVPPGTGEAPIMNKIVRVLTVICYFFLCIPEDVRQVLGTIVSSFVVRTRRWYCKIIQGVRHWTIDSVTPRVLLTPT